jgi:hypothetical protein
VSIYQEGVSIYQGGCLFITPLYYWSGNLAYKNHISAFKGYHLILGGFMAEIGGIWLAAGPSAFKRLLDS